MVREGQDVHVGAGEFSHRKVGQASSAGASKTGVGGRGGTAPGVEALVDGGQPMGRVGPWGSWQVLRSHSAMKAAAGGALGNTSGMGSEPFQGPWRKPRPFQHAEPK